MLSDCWNHFPITECSWKYVDPRLHWLHNIVNMVHHQVRWALWIEALFTDNCISWLVALNLLTGNNKIIFWKKSSDKQLTTFIPWSLGNMTRHLMSRKDRLFLLRAKMLGTIFSAPDTREGNVFNRVFRGQGGISIPWCTRNICHNAGMISHVASARCAALSPDWGGGYPHPILMEGGTPFSPD